MEHRGPFFFQFLQPERLVFSWDLTYLCGALQLQLPDWGWHQERVRRGKNKTKQNRNSLYTFQFWGTFFPGPLARKRASLLNFLLFMSIASSVTQAMLSSKLGNKGGKKPRKLIASTILQILTSLLHLPTIVYFSESLDFLVLSLNCKEYINEVTV